MGEYGKIDNKFEIVSNPEKFASSTNFLRRKEDKDLLQHNVKAKNGSVILTRSPVDNNFIVYEDPCEALNISDDKWNQIVQ